MPLWIFKCQACDNKFEFQCKSEEREAVVCTAIVPKDPDGNVIIPPDDVAKGVKSECGGNTTFLRIDSMKPSSNGEVSYPYYCTSLGCEITSASQRAKVARSMGMIDVGSREGLPTPDKPDPWKRCTADNEKINQHISEVMQHERSQWERE